MVLCFISTGSPEWLIPPAEAQREPCRQTVRSNQTADRSISTVRILRRATRSAGRVNCALHLDCGSWNDPLWYFSGGDQHVWRWYGSRLWLVMTLWNFRGQSCLISPSPRVPNTNMWLKAKKTSILPLHLGPPVRHREHSATDVAKSSLL